MKLTLATTAAGLTTGIAIGLIGLVVGLVKDSVENLQVESRAVAASRR